MKPHKGEIDFWCKVSCVHLGWPDIGLGYAIFGRPHGHPELFRWIRTSPVMVHDEVTGDVETENSLYRLRGSENMDTLVNVLKRLGVEAA